MLVDGTETKAQSGRAKGDQVAVPQRGLVHFLVVHEHEGVGQGANDEVFAGKFDFAMPIPHPWLIEDPMAGIEPADLNGKPRGLKFAAGQPAGKDLDLDHQCAANRGSCPPESCRPDGLTD